MKIFIDECVDWRLSRSLPGHDVKTARQKGWTEIKNGRLLALAAQEFDVFLTIDQNLQHQQNIAQLDLAVLVLRSGNNRLAELRALAPEVLRILPELSPGEVRVVQAPDRAG